MLKHKPVDAIKLATELVNDGFTIERIQDVIAKCRMNTESFRREGEGSERLQSFPIATE